MTEPAKPPIPNFVCPFCGSPTPDQPRCAHCSGPLDPLSRQATQNAMGPWFIRDEQHPFRPGCSYETILAMVARGKITSDTILRGPSTSQFWYPAKRVPGVAHRLASGGVCFSCQHAITTESECPRCGAVFHADPDRQFLGLMPVRALPGTPTHEARQAGGAPSGPPADPSEFARPAFQSQLNRSQIASGRLETEIARLRRRSGILIGVASGSAAIALGAIWVLASGMSQGDKAADSRTPSVARGDSESAANLPQSERPLSRPHPAEADAGSAAPSPAVPQPSAQPEAHPSAPSPSPPAPDSVSLPSEELALLRGTRWP